MPAEPAPPLRLISVPRSRRNWRITAEPGAPSAATAMAGASPRMSTTGQNTAQARMVRVQRAYPGLQRRGPEPSHPIGSGSTTCTAMSGSIASTRRAKTMPMCRGTAARNLRGRGMRRGFCAADRGRTTRRSAALPTGTASPQATRAGRAASASGLFARSKGKGEAHGGRAGRAVVCH